MKTKLLKAFTLIELLIVIVIIGILATALIPRVTGMQDRARYARVEKDFRDFRTAVFLAQSNTNKPLKDITNRACTSCTCWAGVTPYSSEINFRTIASTSPCRLEWISSLRKIEHAAGLQTGSLSNMETDPWGSPYYLDENDMEFSGCVSDFLFMIGPDGLWYGANRADPALSSGDTKGFHIPPIGCPGAY